MSRLFAFGCSFTKWKWHTYVDIFAENFSEYYNIDINSDHYQNWGFPGLGNKAILERLSECHIKNKITKDDIVLVQWSGHLRHDYAIFEDHQDGPYVWRTHGSIFSDYNEHLYDEKWMQNFFDERAYFIHTLNYINLAQNLLENLGCRWFMTSMSDLQRTNLLSEDICGDTPFYEDHKLLEAYKSIWLDHDDRWLEPMSIAKRKMPEDDWWFNLNPGDELPVDRIKGKEIITLETKDGKWLEGHLSPKQAFLYVEEILKRLDMPLDIPDRVIDIVDTYEDLKSQTDHDFVSLLKILNRSNLVEHRNYGF